MTIAEYERSVRETGAPMMTIEEIVSSSSGKPRLRITVDEQDIQAARLYLAANYDRVRHCPIALACYRAGLCVGSVRGYTLTWWSEEECMRTPLPQEATDFVRNFDRGEPVAPVSFWIKF